ncbi:FAD-dependent oxidoreductase [Streptomyces sp. L7]
MPCTDEVAAKWSVSATAQDLVDAFPGWDDRVPAMLSKAKEDVSAFALHHRRRDPVWTDGRVALLGDACHAMLPYQAQGASQAMEDAAVLAEELGRGHGSRRRGGAPLCRPACQARRHGAGRVPAQQDLLPPARRPRSSGPGTRVEELRRGVGLCPTTGCGRAPRSTSPDLGAFSYQFAPLNSHPPSPLHPSPQERPHATSWSEREKQAIRSFRNCPGDGPSRERSSSSVASATSSTRTTSPSTAS